MPRSPQAARSDPRSDPRSGQVQSLIRALTILNAVSHSHDGLSLSEISRAVGLASSTCHRLLTTLESEGFVRFESAQGVWQIGIRAFIVGNAFTRTRDVVAIARPFMRRLMEETGETVNLYVEESGEAVCMGQIESRQMMRAIARPGGRVRLHCSGAGKVLLAYMKEEEIARILRAHGLPRVTGKTLDAPTRLKADLALIRQRGYAIDDEEHAVGLRCVASAIFDEHGTAIAAMSLSGPMARITDALLPNFARAVARRATDISAQYGGIDKGEGNGVGKAIVVTS